MLGKKVAVDLGSQSVRLLVKGEGAVVSEPAVVTRDDWEQGTAGLFGEAALHARAGDSAIRLGRPLSGGSIADAQLLHTLLGHLMVRAVGRQRIFKPDLVVAVMSALSGDDRRLVLDAAMHAGARTVYLIDSVMAGAIGSGVPLTSATGHLAIDIGAGKTDVAVLAMESTIAQRPLPGHGGDKLRADVVAHAERAHGVHLETHVAEDVVASLMRVGVHEERTLTVRAFRAGVEEALTLTSTELAPLLDMYLRPIVGAVHEVIGDTPDALLQDIRGEGIVAFGGGVRLEGLDRHLSAASGLRVHIDGDPLLAVIRGAGYALDNLDVLKRNFMYIR